ncbi:hypothetical protein [Actinoplanes sp. DH11]|uniref:hypothetical protein n=1 Tax=Actinoplanes sp. DH11 TaxID=2857011 RepID=UPI001E4C8FB6|nr:hypothetical protein [Actinoplanes sp. DH11]
MRFSGSPAPPAGDGPDNLDAMDALTFSRLLSAWIMQVWTQRPDVPRDQPELDTFEELALIPEFRRGYPAADWRALGRGATVEQCWLGQQLELRTEMRCLISDAFGGVPVARVSRKTLLEPRELVDSLCRWLTYPRPECSAMVVTGPASGHTVLLTGFDEQEQCIRFRDLWPVSSLLAAPNNSTGITARATTDGQWLVDPEQLAPTLAAVVVEESVWRSWSMYDQFTALRSAVPGSGWDDVELAAMPWHPGHRPAPSAEQAAFDEACKYLSAHESVPGAVAGAACRYGTLLSSRGETAEALHWWRQAAMIGAIEASDRLAAALDQNDPYEAGYWRARWRAEPAAIPAGEHGAGFQQLPDWRVSPAGREFRRGLDLLHRGEPGAATEVFRAVWRSDDKEAAAFAANELGLLMWADGNIVAATAALFEAAVSGCFTPAAHGWANLGRMRDQQGDQRGSEQAYRQAVATGHYDVTAASALALAMNLYLAGRTDEAMTWCEHAVYSNDRRVSPEAAAWLGTLMYAETDDADRSTYFLTRALASENPATIDMAREILGDADDAG